MKYTPLSIKLQEFNKKLRGYDTTEVKAFLNNLSDEYERLFQENESLKAECQQAKAKNSEYGRIEQSLQEVLLKAQEDSKKTIESAKLQAETILQEAENKAKDIIDNAFKKVAQYEDDIDRLKNRKTIITAKIKNILQLQAELLKYKISQRNISNPTIQEDESTKQIKQSNFADCLTDNASLDTETIKIENPSYDAQTTDLSKNEIVFIPKYQNSDISISKKLIPVNENSEEI